MRILNGGVPERSAVAGIRPKAVTRGGGLSTPLQVLEPSARHLSFAGAAAWQGLTGVRFGMGLSRPNADAYEALLAQRRIAAGKKPFRLTAEQKDAIEALARGQGVVADLPTGTGKTLIAEYAIEQGLKNGKSVFYTTPQKALSNQKYTDFAQQYGQQNVGLKTGDVTINPDAPIVIMTTEVYRNMLYDQRNGQPNRDLDNLSAVVFDECHYINDPDRGVVWEESAIYTPPGVQQIHLSATIQNAPQYIDWLNSLNGKVNGRSALSLVSSRERAVPLVYEYLSPDGRLMEVLDRRNPEAMNPEFKSAIRANESRRLGRRQRQNASRGEMFHAASAVETLRQRNRLPADFLVFSRKGCERYANAVYATGTNLLTPDEKTRVEAFINKYLQYYPEIARREEGMDLIPMLKRGIAFHHSGLLPPEKLMVELLLQRGLIKATFSTETLTTGMNVPFRSMVITATSKYGSSGIEAVSDSTFQQAVGRAGRPGMYSPGYAIVTQPTQNDPALGFSKAKRLMDLILSEPNRVESQLEITSAMVLNLLARLSLPEVGMLLEKSFAAFQRGDNMKVEFNRMRKFLIKTGFVSNNNQPKPLGRLAAEISNDHSLLVAKLIAGGVLEGLAPASLAALLSTTVQENNRSATLDQMCQEKGRNAVFSNNPQVQAGIGRMRTQLQALVSSAGNARVNVDSDLYPERIGFIEALCRADADEKLALIRQEQFPGTALNVAQRTANLLKHIAEAESTLVSPELQATARQAIALLMGGPIRNMVEPRLMELPS